MINTENILTRGLCFAKLISSKHFEISYKMDFDAAMSNVFEAPSRTSEADSTSSPENGGSTTDNKLAEYYGVMRSHVFSPDPLLFDEMVRGIHTGSVAPRAGVGMQCPTAVQAEISNSMNARSATYQPNLVNVNLAKLWKRARPEKIAKLMEARFSVLRGYVEMYGPSTEYGKAFVDSSPEHVKRILGNKPMAALHKFLVDHNCADAAIVREVADGVPTEGPVPEAGYFPPELRESRLSREPFVDGSEDPLKGFNRPPHPQQLADVSLFDALWKAVGDEVDKGLAAPIRKDDITRRPDTVFAVKQTSLDAQMNIKEKIRNIYNARHRNHYSKPVERIRLPYGRFVQELARLMRVPCGRELEVLQEMVVQPKSTVTADLARRTGAGKNASFEGVGVPRGSRAKGRQRNRDRKWTLPAFALRDISSAYKQLPVREPLKNCFGLYDRVAKDYQFFQGFVCGFGNLHSVHSWVRFSNMLLWIVNWLHIPALVYIDDFILSAPEDKIHMADEMVGRLFDLLSVAQSEKIFTSQTSGVVKVLGLFYLFKRTEETLALLSPEFHSLPFPLVVVPREKIEKASRQISELRSFLLQEDSWPVSEMTKLAQSVAGMLNFGIISPLHKANCLPLIRSIRDLVYRKDDIEQRKYRLSVAANCKRLLQSIYPTSPLSLVIEPVVMPERHVFTDASLDNQYGAVMGAVVYFPSGSAFGTYWAVAGRNQFKKETIMTYEAGAVLLASWSFAEYLRGARVYIHVDNTADLYAFVKCEAKDRRTHRIVVQVWEELVKMGANPFFLYVPSEKNPADKLTRRPETSVWKVLGAVSARPVWSDDVDADISRGLVENPLSGSRSLSRSSRATSGDLSRFRGQPRNAGCSIPIATRKRRGRTDPRRFGRSRRKTSLCVTTVIKGRPGK